MNYMLMILEPRGQREERGAAEGQVVYDRMLGFAETLKVEGKLRGVESLQGDERGKRVQVRDGRRSLVDGPFAEAKEIIGGIFIVDCASLDEAVALAERCPAAEWATIEVRPAGPCFL